MAPPQDPKIRNIKIKTGVVKRLAKEKKMYEKEAEEMDVKLAKMKADGKDDYDIKKQIEVKNESTAMIPDCSRRLKTAYDELMSILNADKELSESVEYKDAIKELEIAKPEIN